MLEGLSVVRLLGCFKALRTTVKPHRYKAVWYAGRGVDDNSRLEALTVHPSVSRFLLSSNAPELRHTPVVTRLYNYTPTALLGFRYAPRIEAEASASVGSSSFPMPSYIQFGTVLRIKRKKNRAPKGTTMRVLLIPAAFTPPLCLPVYRCSLIRSRS